MSASQRNQLRRCARRPRNPRYTGRPVRNRQRTDFDLVDPGNTGMGHKQLQRWNLPESWIISKHPAHPALAPARLISSPPRKWPHPAAQPGRRCDGTCWPTGDAECKLLLPQPAATGQYITRRGWLGAVLVRIVNAGIKTVPRNPALGPGPPGRR